MSVVYEDPLVTLRLGDCIEEMRQFPAESVDAIVTDPPAGISFMSRNWDHDKGGRTEWVAWMTEVMRECHRVLKPGGYALVWSIPRTCHWTAWAMEDAGFVIRDQLAHIFASGFPKGKAQLKPAREDWWLARKLGPLRPLGIDAGRIGVGSDETVIVRATEQPVEVGIYSPGARPVGEIASANPAGRWPSNVLLSDPELFDQPNPYVVGSGATSVVGWDKTRPPRQTGTVYGEHQASSFDSHGDSGGYSRFFIIPKADRAERERGLAGHPTGYHADMNKIQGDVRYENRCQECDASLPYGTKEHHGKPTVKRMEANTRRANVHPTVKPIDLMRHLVRLVTPPGGVVLDPFLGSGTTCLAASEEGFRSIGVERELEYLEIAKGRLMATPMGLGLDHGLTGKAPPKTHPDLSKHQPKRRAPGENYSGGWAGTDEEPAA
jgi:DNA modification methylase